MSHPVTDFCHVCGLPSDYTPCDECFVVLEQKPPLPDEGGVICPLCDRPLGTFEGLVESCSCTLRADPM